jgi:hypothetical protein
MHTLTEFRTRLMTADEVLAVLRDIHRHYSDNQGDPDAVINYDTTVQEYWFGADAFDVVLWGFNPGEALNEHFRVGFSRDEWDRVLKPCGTRTLRHVCEFLAGRARVAQMEPITLFDRPCLSAGVFLTIRTMLARAGVDVTDLRPSSPLGPYLIDWYPVFLRDVAKMAPGSLPTLRVVNPLYDVCTCSVALAWLTGCLTGFLASIPVSSLWQWFFGACAAWYVGVGLVAYIGHWIAIKTPPRRVEFGSLHDFRDLSRALAGEAIPVASA